jgi:hypothetical protein
MERGNIKKEPTDCLSPTLIRDICGQIKISCYPFFDTAPATITHRQARIKRRVLPNTAGHGLGRADNFQSAPSQTQKIPGVSCRH